MKTTWLLVFFGPAGGSGGRPCRGEARATTREAVAAAASAFLFDERRGFVDVRRETHSADGKIQESIAESTYRWSDRFQQAVRGSFAPTG